MGFILTHIQKFLFLALVETEVTESITGARQNFTKFSGTLLMILTYY